ncbi:MAG TPA: tetratricopeptide repeat protein [Deltaproteobacteria bacterium]|nr:tetratricopeptide repeat protein [Deltaproteobacteria bacterium]
MSYINDALRRLQKEKGSPYEAYTHLVNASVKKPQRSRKLLSLVGILIVFCFAGAMILFLNSLDSKRVQGVSYTVDWPQKPSVAQKPESAKKETEPLKKRIVPVQQKVTKQRGDAKVIYAQALRQHREGKLDDARRLYKEVLGIDPKNVSALNNLGVIYMKQKDYKNAQASFNKALNIKSRYVDAHYNLACLYAQKKEMDKSLFYLKNAIEFDPQVKLWAKNDKDLKFLHDLPEFVSLINTKRN